MTKKATIENALKALVGELVVVEEGDEVVSGRLEKFGEVQYEVKSKVYFIASIVHAIEPATASRLARIIL